MPLPSQIIDIQPLNLETYGKPLAVRFLGRSDYLSTWQTMQQFTHERVDGDQDEIWITEHESVFTQGLNGKPEHLLDVGDIPVIKIDRGGQVTYHGPGQLVVYCMLNLNRIGIGVRSLVASIEQAIIRCLNDYNIISDIQDGAPGVYTQESKIAALGLRIRKGYCYHGLSLNVNMDLQPFSRINPCGFKGLQVSQMAEFGQTPDLQEIGSKLSQHLIRKLYRG